MEDFSHLTKRRFYMKTKQNWRFTEGLCVLRRSSVILILCFLRLDRASTVLKIGTQKICKTFAFQNRDFSFDPFAFFSHSEIALTCAIRGFFRVMRLRVQSGRAQLALARGRLSVKMDEMCCCLIDYSPDYNWDVHLWKLVYKLLQLKVFISSTIIAMPLGLARLCRLPKWIIDGKLLHNFFCKKILSISNVKLLCRLI